MAISSLISETARYWSKIVIFLYPTCILHLILPSGGRSPSVYCHDVRQNTTMAGLSDCQMVKQFVDRDINVLGLYLALTLTTER